MLLKDLLKYKVFLFEIEVKWKSENTNQCMNKQTNVSEDKSMTYQKNNECF